MKIMINSRDTGIGTDAALITKHPIHSASHFKILFQRQTMFCATLPSFLHLALFIGGEWKRSIFSVFAFRQGI